MCYLILRRLIIIKQIVLSVSPKSTGAFFDFSLYHLYRTRTYRYASMYSLHFWAFRPFANSYMPLETVQYFLASSHLSSSVGDVEYDFLLHDPEMSVADFDSRFIRPFRRDMVTRQIATKAAALESNTTIDVVYPQQH